MTGLKTAAAFVVGMGMLTASPHAAGSETASPVMSRDAKDMAAARDGLATLRARSALPSACERAFRGFWSTWRRPGNDGLMKEPYPFAAEAIFGWGNLDAEPLLVAAQQVCADETGARGDLVVAVLRERAEDKEDADARRRAANAMILGY